MIGMRVVRRRQVGKRLTMFGVMMPAGLELMTGGLMMILALGVCEIMLGRRTGGADAADEFTFF
ncbi:MAG: hypothetical protein JWR19_431 [Pedosphaera sp.]|nr:hypothetical protein [Pedosphaera sp.]